MENFNFYTVCLIVLCTYISYIQNEKLFYGSMKKYCKKNKGVCANCSCWSCPRKLYIDEYMEKKKIEKENLHN